MVRVLIQGSHMIVTAARVARGNIGPAEKADALVKASRERANAETIFAEADAAREKTRERLARLVKHQASLQRAAVTDWDSRLSKNPEQGFSPE